MLRAVNALARVGAEVLIRHVKAHHGIDLNEATDRLAEIGQQVEFSSGSDAKVALAYDEMRARSSIVQFGLEKMLDHEQRRSPEGSQVGKYRRFLSRICAGKRARGEPSCDPVPQRGRSTAPGTHQKPT